MGTDRTTLTYVKHLWRDEDADRLSGVDRLVYRSNRLGDDLTLTNTGGGNTSSKLEETDPLTGEPVEVLWVKGSGGDLRTAKRDGFASLYLDKVRAMKPRYLAAEARGPKTPIEDAMYPMYSHCVFNLNPRACSIDTPLHTFVPYRHVDHLHPNAVIAIAASVESGAADARDLRRRRDLRAVAASRLRHRAADRGADREAPARQGVLLGHHGMSSWSNDDKTCYETALEIIDRATALHRGARQGRADLRRRAAPAARRRGAAPRVRAAAAVAARAGLGREALRRHGAGRPEDAALRQQRRRSAAGRARHVVPRPLPAHQDQAALRRLGSRDRRPRRARGVDRGRARTLPRRLRGLLRAAQAAGLAGDARPEPDGGADPRARHDRVGQEQERVARDRRVLQLRDRGDARRRGDRPLRGDGPAGGVRHRVLVARGGEAAAPAAREGARPAGHRGHRRRRRDRQGDRPPRW